MIDRHSLIRSLHDYHSSFTEELKFRDRFISLLTLEKAFERTTLPGHITGSAWIVDPATQNVLLTHHAKLNRWLQPGGHADGDENIIRVVLREASEETGLNEFRYSPLIFDIDIHPIPERNGFPAHDHYDIRILLTTSNHLPLTVTAESHDLAWLPMDDVMKKVGMNASIDRMLRKTRLLF